MENLERITIQKHQWIPTSDGWGEICKYCNSAIGHGTGTDHVGYCIVRFDEEKFQSWVEARNFAKLPNTKGTKTVKYNKRFSSDIRTERQLIVEYCGVMGITKVSNKKIKELRNNGKS